MAARPNSRPPTDTRRAVPAEDDTSGPAAGAVSTLTDPGASISNPDHYKVVFENERVRVLEYSDQPGDSTTPHEHPDSVMYTLTSFRRPLPDPSAAADVIGPQSV
jgi:hypothetical protein